MLFDLLSNIDLYPNTKKADRQTPFFYLQTACRLANDRQIK